MTKVTPPFENTWFSEFSKILFYDHRPLTPPGPLQLYIGMKGRGNTPNDMEIAAGMGGNLFILNGGPLHKLLLPLI